MKVYLRLVLWKDDFCERFKRALKILVGFRHFSGGFDPHRTRDGGRGRGRTWERGNKSLEVYGPTESQEV